MGIEVETYNIHLLGRFIPTYRKWYLGLYGLTHTLST